MPNVATAATATAAQTSAAGSRMLGYYLGVGGVKVDCLFDTANFVTRTAAGDFISSGTLHVQQYTPGVIAKFEGASTNSFLMENDGAGLATFSCHEVTFAIENKYAPGAMTFKTGGSERMRLSSSGHLGIGTAAPANTLHISRADQSTARIRIQNTAVAGRSFELVAGIDNVSQGDFSIFDVTNGGTLFAFGVNYFRAGGDNSASCGTSGNRWSVVYAVTGTINTSDERDKTWREVSIDDRAIHMPSCTHGEMAAARRIGSELGFFQWNDAIAEKGTDDARLHFGVRAQRVWAIMAEEGLIDPLAEGAAPHSKYAFLCWDEWDSTAPVEAVEEVRDENGNVTVEARPAQPGRDAGDHFGVRTDQLALFLIAAQEARIAALEAA